MNQFEFKFVSCSNPIYALPLKHELRQKLPQEKLSYTEVINILGKEGWQIVGVIPSGGEFGAKGDADIIMQRMITATPTAENATATEKLKAGIYQYTDSDDLVWARYQKGFLIVENGLWEIKQREDGTPYSPDSNRNLKYIMEAPSELDVVKQLSEIGVGDLEAVAQNYNLVLIAAKRMMEKE